jgi:hypothetical protein
MGRAESQNLSPRFSARCEGTFGSEGLVAAIGFGARGFAHEAGIADARSVFQGEVHSAIRVNRGAAFSTDICEGFAHRL